MAFFSVVVFVSAFLLFAVEPMVAKFLLPAFGGTAAVWSTCLVFFQTLLVAGYAYAHFLRSRLQPNAQRWTHLIVIALTLCFLPPVPVVHLLTDSAATPVWELLRSLIASVGLPFFALSATAPLLMEWFRQANPTRSAHRLYAVSNAGSLLALIAYPVLLEPNFTRTNQARLWAIGMGLFFILCASIAWLTRSTKTAPVPHDAGSPASELIGLVKTSMPGSNAPLPTWLWVTLPACGSGLLLALTNQLSQDVTPIPLLWVAPMGVYLISFILCFEGSRAYVRSFFIPACFLSFGMLAWLLHEGYLYGFWLQVTGYLVVLFLACMVCHGELYRLRPPAHHLTAFYFAMSIGGALGGIFVALVAPIAFKTLLETPLLAGFVMIITAFIVLREQPKWHFFIPPVQVIAVGTLVVSLALVFVVVDLRKDSIYYARNFYGAYRIKESPTLPLDGIDFQLSAGPARVLLSGQIYHGLQFVDPEASKIITTYFCEEGGLGIAFRAILIQTNRNIGVIGLGAGTVSAYGKAGDHIRFYELNPDVAEIARREFRFIANSAANVQIILGDGRLSLEREPNQAFDLLVLDAFAGDAIPAHLLTAQSMKIYQRHLKADGLMAFHVSNSHLDLDPVVRALAENVGMSVLVIPVRMVDPREGKLPSVWILLTKNAAFLKQPLIAEILKSSTSNSNRKKILWTDDYSSILPILH